MWSDGRVESANHHPQVRDEDAPDARDHEHSDEDEHRAADDVDQANVALEPGDRARDPAESESDKQERDAQAEAVGECEDRAPPRVAAVKRERVDRGQGWTDAGCPAEAEHD